MAINKIEEVELNGYFNYKLTMLRGSSNGEFVLIFVDILIMNP